MAVLAHGFLVGVRARLLLLKVFLRYVDAIHDAVTTPDVGDNDLFLDAVEVTAIPGAPPVARWRFKHGGIWTPFGYHLDAILDAISYVCYGV